MGQQGDLHNISSSFADRQLLLSETCRSCALSELRSRFDKVWFENTGAKCPSWGWMAFNDWYVEAINAVEPLWPPLPGPFHDATDSDPGKFGIMAWSEFFQGPFHIHEECANPTWRDGTPSLYPQDAEGVRKKVDFVATAMLSAVDETRERWSSRCEQATSCRHDDLAALSVELSAVELPACGEGRCSMMRLKMCGELPFVVEGSFLRQFDIDPARVETLKTFYQKHHDKAFPDGSVSFEAACWALLSRYHSMFGPDDEMSGAHMALCPEVFQNLAEDFGVDCELFASPLNFQSPSYCSLFPDVDRCFGSRGTFWQFFSPKLMQGGSFECNPPFEEHFIQRVVNHLEEALASATEALSIALIMPGWAESNAIRSSMESIYSRGNLLIEGKSHAWLSGVHHRLQGKERIIHQTRGRGTYVVFLQNDAAVLRWPVTATSLRKHRLAWMQSWTVHESVPEAIVLPSEHRLHYRWAQLEADKQGVKPLITADRVLHVSRDEDRLSRAHDVEEPFSAEQEFECVQHIYGSTDYNTFCTSFNMNLAEVEMRFLSSKMNKASSCEWALVYLGMRWSERFRRFRDTFFPGLTVVGFNGHVEPHVEPGSLKELTELGPNSHDFLSLERSFDDEDCSWIQDRVRDRSLLLISSIGRGKVSEEMLKFQLHVVRQLSPVSSMVSFKPPAYKFYRYAAGTMLKEVFQGYGDQAVRLVIDGVPTSLRWYNCFEFDDEMVIHHQSLRGDVYEQTRPSTCMACLCSCFDCCILWETIADYAQCNRLDPSMVLRQVVGNCGFTPVPTDEGKVREHAEVDWTSWTLEDAAWLLTKGRLTEAIAALELDVHNDRHCMDLQDFATNIAWSQPGVAERLKQEFGQGSASLSSLLLVLGTLPKPFTFLRSAWNAPFTEQTMWRIGDDTLWETCEKQDQLDETKENVPWRLPPWHYGQLAVVQDHWRRCGYERNVPWRLPPWLKDELATVQVKERMLNGTKDKLCSHPSEDQPLPPPLEDEPLAKKQEAESKEDPGARIKELEEANRQLQLQLEVAQERQLNGTQETRASPLEGEPLAKKHCH